MIKINDNQQKFARPGAGVHTVKAVALVDHGTVTPTVVGYKPQHKFTIIFATADGFQLMKTCSNSWGDKSSYKKFITQWSGKTPDKVVDPDKLLGYGGEGYLVESGEYLNLQALTKMRKAEGEFKKEVWISDYLRNMGDNFEVIFAPGHIQKVQTSSDDRTEAKLAANAHVTPAVKQTTVAPPAPKTTPTAQPTGVAIAVEEEELLPF